MSAMTTRGKAAVARKKPKATTLLETDLYGPVRDYLVAQGYTVRGEVHGCDVAAMKDGDLVVVELKRHFGVKLLYQATRRQRLSDSVYVAVPRPKKMGRGSRWRDVKRLLRRLELGLMLVSFSGRKPRVEVVFHPSAAPRRKNTRARRAVIQEMAGRSSDHNTGGSPGRKLLTAYRENALLVAVCLDAFGSLSPKQLRAMDTGPKTQSVLYQNVYGWFDRVGHALYALAPAGEAALGDYPELVAQFRESVAELGAGLEVQGPDSSLSA